MSRTVPEEVYRGPGVTFRYPAGWELAEEARGDERSIHVQSEGSAFCSITLLPTRPTPLRAVEAAVDAFREEYAEFDVYPVETRLARRAAVGRDIDFICLEMSNTACVRALRTARFTLLLLFQSNDHELDQTRSAFERICETLDCDTDLAAD